MQVANRYPKGEMMRLADIIACELACRGCQGLMWRPIQHCIKGHAYCQKCYKIGELCKLCGNEQIGNRSYNIERLVDMLTISCRFEDKGCNRKLPFAHIEQHENECQSYKFKCPFDKILKCPFTGLKQQMIFHCLLVHGQFTFVDRTPSEKKLYFEKILRENAINHPASPSYFFCDNEHMFRVLLKLTKKSMFIKVSQMRLPSDTEPPHDCILKIYNENYNVLKAYRHTCCLGDDLSGNNFQQLKIDLQMVNCSNYFVISFERK
ncbi:hypothetical protein YQE_03037, partial [Dendroctonus ponderosae]